MSRGGADQDVGVLGRDGLWICLLYIDFVLMNG